MPGVVVVRGGGYEEDGWDEGWRGGDEEDENGRELRACSEPVSEFRSYLMPLDRGKFYGNP